MVLLHQHGTCYVIGETRSVYHAYADAVFLVSGNTPALEMSMLNTGTMFDVELQTAWNHLTGEVAESDKLWVYVLR